MNPDKLFDYLDGRLPDWERAQIEKQIAEDPQLQKEFAAARRIHSNIRDDSREIIIPDETEVTERGRKMALRVGTAFVILVAVNVAAGLFFIARHEAANPNRQLLQQQAQEQFLASARRAAAGLKAAPLATDLNIVAGPGQFERVADQVVMAAQRLGGSATKGLPDGHGLAVLADVPASRDAEFRAAMATPGGATSSSPTPNELPADSGEKESFVVHVMESASP